MCDEHIEPNRTVEPMSYEGGQTRRSAVFVLGANNINV